MPTVDEMLGGTPDPPPIPAVLLTAASRMPWRKLAQLSLSLPGHFQCGAHARVDLRGRRVPEHGILEIFGRHPPPAITAGSHSNS